MFGDPIGLYPNNSNVVNAGMKVNDTLPNPILPAYQGMSAGAFNAWKQSNAVTEEVETPEYDAVLAANVDEETGASKGLFDFLNNASSTGVNFSGNQGFNLGGTTGGNQFSGGYDLGQKMDAKFDTSGMMKQGLQGIQGLFG